jgi:hypothetical protein
VGIIKVVLPLLSFLCSHENNRSVVSPACWLSAIARLRRSCVRRVSVLRVPDSCG